jgi:hypothetical protein|tara:strand:- start:157 stop:576 length:420 start_codon:yes stop_codon:yes gene_type:complete
MTTGWGITLATLLTFISNASFANDLDITQIGDDFVLNVNQDGENHEAEIIVDGDENDVALMQTGASKYAYLDMDGTPHDFDISQTGSGNHYLSINITTGSMAIADINSTQYGTNSMSYTVNGSCWADTGCALNISQNGN